MIKEKSMYEGGLLPSLLHNPSLPMLSLHQTHFTPFLARKKKRPSILTNHTINQSINP
jgi:hypothetical protein